MANHAQMLQRERPKLITLAAFTIVWLLAFLVGGVLVVFRLLSQNPSGAANATELLISIIGGTLGSAGRALVSVVTRISHGWELSDGSKYPREEPKDKFVANMVPAFVIRPILGSFAGLVAYAGLAGGLLVLTLQAQDTPFNLYALLFVTLVVGYLAKTFLERLTKKLGELAA